MTATSGTLASIPVPLRSQRSARLPRRGSFTEAEEFCLRALLLDRAPGEPPMDAKLGCLDNNGYVYEKYRHSPEPRKKEFDDNVLFQLPFGGDNNKVRASNKFGRNEKKLLGLWQAHEEGVHHLVMNNRKSSSNRLPTRQCSSGFLAEPSSTPNHRRIASEGSKASQASWAGALSVKTDIEVRPGLEHDDNSSWDEEAPTHYDAWEVLKDEYAEDFGFDYKENLHSIKATLEEDDDTLQHVFKILGTSADDNSAQPHVLSPPLMDSLLNFAPTSVSMENYWMKFSLIRDGASLYTLKQYVKAAPCTLLAIETTKGHVFGSFTSNIWKNHPTFFGGAPSFLWRMRHNRRTVCHSLFEQAQLESEIDVYASSGLNDLFQVCDEHRLAIGGGKLTPDGEEPSGDNGHGIKLDDLKAGESYGFGIALDDDLLSGTTSPCGTFRNPCLIDPMSKGEVFDVANIEVWTYTPCADVQAAERMEMTRYFLEESIRSVTSSTASSAKGVDLYSNPFNSQDEFQRDFYRRVGQHERTGPNHKYGTLIAASGVRR
ncbi:TLDc [Seminavis robusta]|uniref:Oxidation resistance protein 1 n=1 Tax=Seminavis robusta TaxID=568900 RepID=A0A9N8H315_9STRA|nr:TLDc [Seminavis robusta]|eukprot:Sro49_g028460.1 TLDc (544) ;mRNA; f:7521-9235